VLAQLKPGQKIPVEVIRNGKRLTIEVTLGELKSG
jgi:S1-C subfamily serine protease